MGRLPRGLSSWARTALAGWERGEAALTLSLGLLVAQIRAAYAEPRVTKPRLDCGFGSRRNGHFNRSVRNRLISTRSRTYPPARSLLCPEERSLAMANPLFTRIAALLLLPSAFKSLSICPAPWMLPDLNRFLLALTLNIFNTPRSIS